MSLIKLHDRALLPGIIVGLTCTINGFYISLGSVNVRINDIAFYLLFIIWIIYPKPIRNYYNNNILKGIAIIGIMFIYMITVRMYNFNTYPSIYQDFFIKYLINKLLWFPIYIAFYMLYGGKQFIYGVLFGIGVSSILDSFLVIGEYTYIISGREPDYSFIKTLGIAVEEKKLKVFNQGLIRPTGFMIDPNYTGAYAGIGTLFWDYVWHKFHKKKYIIFSILSIIPMVLLFSRTGLFSFILCFLFSLLIFSKKKNRNVVAPYVMITFSIVLIFLFIYVFSNDQDLIDNIIRRASMQDGSSMTRLDYIEYYFSHANMVELLFGVGMAGSYLAPFFGIEEVLHPESSYISMLMEYGCIFMTLYLFLLLDTLRKLIKRDYYLTIIFIYINLIGISYNFLGDRLYYFLIVCFILYTYVKTPSYSKYLTNNVY